MKHIIAYPLWEAFRFKEANPIQREFMERLLAKCDELGIQVDNQATDLQKKNNTYIINFAPSDVLKLFLESSWQQYSSGIRKGKAERLAKNPEFNLFKGLILSMDKPEPGTAHWIIVNDNIRHIISPWSSRGSGFTQHSSQRTVIFGEMQNVEEALGRFFNELVLVLVNRVNYLDAMFRNDLIQRAMGSNLFERVEPTQLKAMISKYPDFSWKQVFAQAEMPQATFQSIVRDPGFSEELKEVVLGNPHYSSYEKVEDILGDWG